MALAEGCGSSIDLPRPATVETPTGAFHEVPYPPPAALVEAVPPRPTEGAVWIDGTWLWRFGRWVWDRGGWVVPARGAAYAPWRTVYRTDGTLWFAPSMWVLDGRPTEPPEVLRPANPPPSELIPEDATPP